MKLNHVFLLHITGLIPVAVSILGTIPHKYDLIMTPMSWPDAQNYCREKFTNLATIQSVTDWLRFNKEAESKALTSPAWVGLYNDIDSWRWSLNERMQTFNPFTNWGTDQPDNNKGNQACGVLGANKWRDALCTKLKPFICYDATVSDADKFIGIATTLTWPEAQIYCRTHHTDMASSFNSTDNNMLGQITSIQGDSWIGLYRDTWKWSDNASVSDLTWSSGQPDNSLGNEDCAVIYNGQFSDEPCNESHYFFCHTLSPNWGQIMRVEVKPDGSVFDPAVQLPVLQKIQKKLEEKVEFNVIATWMRQSDGNIFHKKKEKDEL